MDQTFEKRKKVIYDFICDDFYVPMKIKEIAMVLQITKEQRKEKFCLPLPDCPALPAALSSAPS